MKAGPVGFCSASVSYLSDIFLEIYHTNLCQICTVVRITAVDDQSKISFSILKGRCRGKQFLLVLSTKLHRICISASTQLTCYPRFSDVKLMTFRLIEQQFQHSSDQCALKVTVYKEILCQMLILNVVLQKYL